MTLSSRVLRSLAGFSSLLVAACAAPVNGPEDGLPVEARFPITVAPRMESLAVPYDPARGLDPEREAGLRQFARDYLENGSGAIAVSPSRRYPEAAETIAARLRAFGVPANRILFGSDSGSAAAEEVRVSYIRYTAQAAPCGDWSRNLGYTSENKVPPNFGCATQHNLAAIVADPRDLVTPKPLDPDDARRRLTVLEKYRKGEPTPAQKTTAQSGSVSTVAAGGGGGM